MSPARTPEAEIKRRLGIMNRNVFDTVIKGLDHIGDAADMAQRVAVYKRVLAETGNETQALYQAANVINFLHHGSAGYIQAIVKTVPFFGAYANATDVLVRALLGGGLKGVKRRKALMRLGITVTMLTSLTLLYCMLAGGDPEYDELDDQTKLRNIIIPGTKIMLPMNTSAAFIFKALPELIYNRVTREGTNNEYDRKRLHKALAEVAKDTLLGPEPIPAGIKPILEIGINRNFFTGRPIIPEGIKDLEAAEQYTAATSELGKKISAMLEIPGTDNKRVLSPVEADHLIRGIFGTAGAMGQWVSNSIGAMSEVRPEPTAREAPITGSFLREEVPRGREDLFYDFKDRVNEKYKTWTKMMDREDFAAADEYVKKHGDVAAMYDYVNETENELKEINAEIRRIGETKAKDMTPEERRKEIQKFQDLKQEILDPVKQLRREAFGTGFGVFSK
jgi:Large polyvalent protein associated domain 38